MGVKAMFLMHEALDGRDGHSVGRELLAKLYAQATGESLPAIAVTPRGKPYFSDGNWHFSISHTDHFAFCALSRHNIGLDAEEKGRKVTPAMLDKFTSDAEKCRLGEDPQDAFLRLWVLKEADAKRTGRGMGNWLKDTDFDPFDPRIQEINGCYVAVLEDNDAF
jgi:phosphopantetheinyl transferase